MAPIFEAASRALYLLDYYSASDRLWLSASIVYLSVVQILDSFLTMFRTRYRMPVSEDRNSLSCGPKAEIAR